METLFQRLILVSIFFSDLCSADTDKLILKSYDLPYCVVINQNVTASNCIWHSDSDSPKPVRFLQQQITVHSVVSSDPLDNTSPEVDIKGSSNHTYLFRINHNVCLVMTNSGAIGTGKCSVRKARFVIRSAYINSKDDTKAVQVRNRAYSIEIRSSARECVGFPSRKNNSLLIKKPCNYAPENVRGQLWTFCNAEGRCNLSPTLQALTTTTETPADGNDNKEDVVAKGSSNKNSDDDASTGNGCYIQFASPVLVLLYSTLAILLANI